MYIYVYIYIYSCIYIFIIQHIDTLPKYGKKTLDVRDDVYDVHDVYPTIDVSFSILTRECQNLNFVLLSMCQIIKLL